MASGMTTQRGMHVIVKKHGLQNNAFLFHPKD